MRKRSIWMVAVFGILTALVAGCYESPQVTLHEPGVYKGDKDPLLAQQRQPEHQERLRERFAQVQTDR